MIAHKTKLTDFLLVLAYFFAFYTVLLFIIGLIVALATGRWSPIWPITLWGLILGASACLVIIIGTPVILILEKLEQKNLIKPTVVTIIITCVCAWALWNYVNDELPPFSDYVSGDVVPKGWRKGEWMNYTANHPNKVHVLYLSEQEIHDNTWLRRRFGFLKGGN